MSQSENRRMDQIISIRCTAWEKQMLEKVAAVCKVSVSEFVRSSALTRAHEIVDALADRAANGDAA